MAPVSPQEGGADFCDVGGRSDRVGKNYAVIAGIRLGQTGELVVLLPVETPAVYNHAAQSGAVPADELGGRMHHHVRSMLNRAPGGRG